MMDIGTQRQLFVDDFIVERTEHVARIFHPVTKHPKPVIGTDRPWEASGFLGVLGNCVFFDEEEGLYKMYYLAYRVRPDLSETLHVALATSGDGLHWEKPALSIADYKGSRDNNLLFDFEGARYTRDWWAHNNVIRDPHDPDPARRYKALGHGKLDRNRPHARIGVIVAFSPDGLHWTEPSENPVLPNADTHTLLGWDDAIGRYVAYPRTCGLTGYASYVRHHPEGDKYVARYNGTIKRCIGYSTSEDFLHWTDAETVLAPDPEDPPDYEIYGMPVFKYEGLYIGLPWAFIGSGGEPLDTQLAVSRDGKQWRKIADGAKLIPLGPPGAFDDCYAISACPVRVGDELFFYYMGCGFPHGALYRSETKREGAIGLGRLRVDGFVSLACRLDSGGWVSTKSLRFKGGRLEVNCSCANGWLRVALHDAQDHPIAGFTEADCDPIRVDAVRHEVTWGCRSDVRQLEGEPVKVRFRFGDGEIYSFGFVE